MSLRCLLWFCKIFLLCNLFILWLFIGGVEDGIIFGRFVFEVCYVEVYIDYGGVVVWWGLIYYVESVVDCCVVCLK